MIRPMTRDDTPAVRRILEESHEAGRWVPQEPSQLSLEVLVCELEGQVVGMIVARTVAGESEILNLAVSPAWRRRGVGGQLVDKALAGCKAAGAGSVFLEVRESNAAGRAFYGACGFFEVGRRTGYYRWPEEDALVLYRSLF